MARHNLRTVIGFEVTRTLNKRRFWVTTLFVPVALIVVFLLIFLSNSSTSTTAAEQGNARFPFQYTDASGLINPGIVKNLGGTLASDEQAGIAAVKAGSIAAFFAYPADPTQQAIQVYGADQGVFNNGKYESVAQSILQASVEQKIDSPQDSAIIRGDIMADTTTFRNGSVSGGINALVPALLFLALFYVTILLLGNQMLSSTLEEKENRVTEMILTTINPTSLLLGKVVSLFLVGIIQMFVFAIPVVLGYIFFKNQLNFPSLDLNALVFEPQQMIVGALILIGGFSLFTGTLVALGAVMPTAKDAGPIYGALMVLIFIPFYTVSLVVSDPNAFIVQLFSFFPYSAPVTALLRNAFETLPLWQAAIIILMLFVLSAIVLRIAVQLFKHGSIEYSRKVPLKSVLRGTKNTTAGRH
ncbi:ABC transporter permease [Paeniglutamicibacter cryotolerans]|uniref:ABC-2 type transport system permease protein n=1 Tax=Paeniglutamicibacter cryotolerans TaxID=670079 RepID=A0A839QE92_9MICC|nr:ABC transporter permease [Paeniglutamicibacter cryotolerans]MBB2994230.1 ABC-2 type transport system permease protein [Paeniglutamicibacter cryotolerans]